MRREDKEYLDLVAMGIRAELKALSEMQQHCTGEITQRQDITNGNVKEIDKRCEDLNCKTKYAQWIQRNPAKTIIASILLIAIIIVMVTAFGLKEIFQFILNKSV